MTFDYEAFKKTLLATEMSPDPVYFGETLVLPLLLKDPEVREMFDALPEMKAAHVDVDRLLKLLQLEKAQSIVLQDLGKKSNMEINALAATNGMEEIDLEDDDERPAFGGIRQENPMLVQYNMNKAADKGNQLLNLYAYLQHIEYEAALRDEPITAKAALRALAEMAHYDMKEKTSGISSLEAWIPTSPVNTRGAATSLTLNKLDIDLLDLFPDLREKFNAEHEQEMARKAEHLATFIADVARRAEAKAPGTAAGLVNLAAAAVQPSLARAANSNGNGHSH